ncbi:LOW QUALITY PROTEIN: hypothetical protein U9M48_030197 [Paspalum notatum var. saurae]|uniref:Uncharacterized protein n=1 Tax=Paspalum notatum var. saurae TaxID=547442 RepID=A0AAQ3X312_PASNO
MSDHHSVQDAMSARLELQRCNGAPGCPCMSSSSSKSTGTLSSPSPSGSRTRSSQATDSGSSLGHSGWAPRPPMQETNDSAVPEGHAVQEWSGLDSISIGKCEHGRRCVLKKLVLCGQTHWEALFGMPIGGLSPFLQPIVVFMDVEEQCQFMEWVEDPWLERVQCCLKELWMELKATRRCEATANTFLIEALQIKEVATEANANLVKKVNRTKKLAHQVCAHYHTKAEVAVKHSTIMMNLIYCLIGVIAFLVTFVVVLHPSLEGHLGSDFGEVLIHSSLSSTDISKNTMVGALCSIRIVMHSTVERGLDVSLGRFNSAAAMDAKHQDNILTAKLQGATIS